MKVTAPIVLLVIGCLLVCQPADAQYLNPKIVEKKVTVHTAVILPAKVEIMKESAKGAEMMVAESEQTSKAISEAVGETLQLKNITVLKSPFEGESATMDENRRYQLADIQKRYDELLSKLVDKSKDVKKARFSLGDEVMLLNVDKSTDALIFIRGQGRVFTKGKTIFSALNLFALDFPMVLITIGIVDARTGDVLVFTKPAKSSSVLKDPKSLNKLIKESLKKLPATSQL